MPVGQTGMERAVACAMDSPFGGIGWTRHAAVDTRIEVDTVTYGAFRPEAFQLAGRFDESLVRNQDDEFNLRLRLSGGRIVLDPSIRVRYRPRGSLTKVFRQYFEYGLWKVPVMLEASQSTQYAQSRSDRVRVLRGCSCDARPTVGSRTPHACRRDGSLRCPRSQLWRGQSIRRRGETWTLLPATAATFLAFHGGYGLGMLRGWLGTLRS